MKSDAQLQQDVQAELKWEPAVHAAQIGVEVLNGVVTLAGEVASYGEKWSAEQAAQRVSGVMALAVELKVHVPQAGAWSDADIARSAKNVVVWASTLPEDTVKVLVEGGWITLSGTVDWQFQRQHIGDSVRYLPGVKGLSNQIAIKPHVSATTVKTDIEAALQRRAHADAKSITVEVSDGNVTLTGTVHSWSERDLTKQAAWNTAGVRNVIDRMTLVY